MSKTIRIDAEVHELLQGLCWPRADEREAAEDDAGMDAEERWYALHDGWVQ